MDNERRAHLRARARNKDLMSVLIHGGAGTGKSTLVREMVKEYQSKCKVFVVSESRSAAVGFAASCEQRPDKVLTLHRMFGLTPRLVDQAKTRPPKDQGEFLVKNGKHPGVSPRANGVMLIVMEEVFSWSSVLMRAFVYWYRSVRLVGAKVCLIALGDVMQLAPVDGSRWFLETDAMAQLKFETHELTQQMRALDTEERLLECIHNARFGRLNHNDADFLRSRTVTPPEGVPQLVCLRSEVEKIHGAQLAEAKENNLGLRQFRPTYSANATEMDLEDYNLQEVVTVYIGAPILFVATQPGLYNKGDVGLVVATKAKRSVMVDFQDGKDPVRINYHKFELDDPQRPKASFRMVPFILACAVTVHAAQGLTLEAAIISPYRYFTGGMLYVMLTRVRTEEGLFIAQAESGEDLDRFYGNILTEITVDPVSLDILHRLAH